MAVASPTVTVAVSVTTASPAPWAGRVTMPSVATMAGAEDAQVTVAPWLPESGSVRLPRTSSGWTRDSAGGGVLGLGLVVLLGQDGGLEGLRRVPEPRVRVAVSVTAAGSWRAPGRVTAPLVLITAGSLEAQAMPEPNAPVAGRVRLPVTADRSPRLSASMSADSRLASVSEMSETSAAVSARL